MEPKSDKKANVISIENFNTFLNDKQITSDDNKDKLYESFLIFQKFMSYMIDKEVNERKDNSSCDKEKGIIELSERKGNNTMNTSQIKDDKLIDKKPNDKEVNDINDKSISQHIIDTSIKLNETSTYKTYINYDDIPIKPLTINFVELVEKNLAELHYQPEPNNDINQREKRKLIKNRTLQLNKRNQLSQSQNSKKRKKSESPQNNEEKTKSLPKTKKLSNSNSNSNANKNKKDIHIKNQIKEEIKDDEEEEKPKALPNFIKEKEKEDEAYDCIKGDNDENGKKKHLILSHSDKLKINPPQYNEEIGNKTNIVCNSQSLIDKSSVNESDDIINNCDSSSSDVEEDAKQNTKEVIDTVKDKRTKEQIREEKNKEIIDELNKIKGNVNSIINNPIYNKVKENNIQLKKNNKENIVYKDKKLLKKDDNKNNSKNISTELNKQQQQINYEEEIAKLKESNLKNKQLKKEYQEMKEALQKDIDAFNYKKKKEYQEIERIKNEELSKANANKLKASKSFNNHSLLNQQQINEYQLMSKRDKEEIEQLKCQIIKLQEEIKAKDNNHKQSIDKLKKQLAESTAEIAQLHKTNRATLSSQNTATYRHAISHTNPNCINRNKRGSKGQSESFSNKPKMINTQLNINTNNNNNIRVIKDSNLLAESYELSFPSKYNIGVNDVVVKREQFGEGKEMLTYSNNMKEIIFASGVKKKVYEDGYQIIFFNNNDIKQIFPNGKNVYYFAESKITQTSFSDNLHVYLFPNGQIEKHYPNGNREIISKPNPLLTHNITSINLTMQSNRNHHKKLIEDNTLPNKANASKQATNLIKLRTSKNKDGSELYQFS